MGEIQEDLYLIHGVQLLALVHNIGPFISRSHYYLKMKMFCICFLKHVLYLFKVDRHVDLLEVAQETDGFSGSDLKEMCRDAALLCVREYVNSASEER